jgi:hypothetical protein
MLKRNPISVLDVSDEINNVKVILMVRNGVKLVYSPNYLTIMRRDKIDSIFKNDTEIQLAVDRFNDLTG